MAKLDSINYNGTKYELAPEIAPLFSSNSAYTKGDCVIHEAVLYKFIANHAAGAWVGTDAEAIEVADRLNKISNSVAPEFDSSASYTAGSYVYKNGVLYRFTAAHSGAWTGNDVVALEVGSEISSLKTQISDTNMHLSAIGAQWFNGYYQTSNNAYAGASSSAWKTSSIYPCKQGDTLYVCTVNSQTNRYVVAFFNSNRVFIGGAYNIGTDFVEAAVIIPNDAEYFRVLMRTADANKTYFRYGSTSSQTSLIAITERITALRKREDFCYVSATNGSNIAARYGTKNDPFRTVTYALDRGFRKIYAEPGLYNESINIEGGVFELIPWVEDQVFSDPFRPKIRFIKGTKLETLNSEVNGIVQASYGAQSGTNIYKIFVDRSLSPTTNGDLAIEYNSLIVGDMPDTSTASAPFNPYRQRLYTPVLTENELSAEGTFWYNGTDTIKIHAWNNKPDSEYFVIDDDADVCIQLTNMEKVHLEDVKALGAYNYSVLFDACNNVELLSCIAGFSAKGMGFRFDNTNLRAINCHAYACSVDGFNFHEYGNSEIVNCSAFYCGDDGISHHQGCHGFIDGGECAYCGEGGITIAFGAQINVSNSYTHNNRVGLNYLGQSTSVREVMLNNCLSIDNTVYDIYNDFYVINGFNVVCREIYDRYDSARSKLRQYGFTILES